jgi:hypothetical protein
MKIYISLKKRGRRKSNPLRSRSGRKESNSLREKERQQGIHLLKEEEWPDRRGRVQLFTNEFRAEGLANYITTFTRGVAHRFYIYVHLPPLTSLPLCAFT